MHPSSDQAAAQYRVDPEQANSDALLDPYDTAYPPQHR